MTKIKTLREVECEHVKRVFDACRGHTLTIGKHLGIHQSKVYRLLKKHGIELMDRSPAILIPDNEVMDRFTKAFLVMASEPRTLTRTEIEQRWKDIPPGSVTIPTIPKEFIDKAMVDSPAITRAQIESRIAPPNYDFANNPTTAEYLDKAIGALNAHIDILKKQKNLMNQDKNISDRT